MPGELALDRREVGEIRVHELAQLGVGRAGCGAADREHGVDVGREQTLAQQALTDHASCPEEDDLHGDGIVAQALAPSRVP